MLTLTFPKPSNTAYAHGNFPGLNNLIRQTEINRSTAREYLFQGPHAVENQHILVGLLQTLSIDPNWDLETVVTYTQFRANMLASTFKITNMNRVGDAIQNGVYKENARELWVLIENDRSYSLSDISLDNMRPVVPFYSTRIRRGYRANFTRDRSTTTPPGDLAIIGVDLVELAIGYWLFMQDDVFEEEGIHSYVTKYPLYYAQMIHNQLAVVNILYEFVVKGYALDELFVMDPVSFASVSEYKLLREYFIFNVNWATDRRLTNLEQLMNQFKPIYSENYSNILDRGLSGVLSQTVWAWEPMVLKWLAIYLSIANQMKYRATGYNQDIARCLPAMKKRYQKLKERYFMEHFSALADEVFLLNEKNMK